MLKTNAGDINLLRFGYFISNVGALLREHSGKRIGETEKGGGSEAREEGARETRGRRGRRRRRRGAGKGVRGAEEEMQDEQEERQQQEKYTQ